MFQVCKTWCHVLYSETRFWDNLAFVIYYNQLRPLPNPESINTKQGKADDGITESTPPSLVYNTGHQFFDTTNEPFNVTYGMTSIIDTTSSVPIDEFNQVSNVNSNIDGQIACFQQSGCQALVNFPSMLLYPTEPMNSYDQLNKWIDSTSNQLSTANGDSVLWNTQMLMLSFGQTGQKDSYNPFWKTLALLDKNDFRTRLYHSLKLRGFDKIRLQGVTDMDLFEFTAQMACNNGFSKFVHVSICHSSITDKGLELFLPSTARSLQTFELIG